MGQYPFQNKLVKGKLEGFVMFIINIILVNHNLVFYTAGPFKRRYLVFLLAIYSAIREGKNGLFHSGKTHLDYTYQKLFSLQSL